MHNSVQKKRPAKGAPPRKERRDAVKSATKAGSSVSTIKKKAPVSKSRVGGPLSALGIEWGAETVRKAVILSEIIGKPVSMRGRRR